MRRWLPWLLLSTIAFAADGDPRGWSPGVPAANALRVLTPSEPVLLQLPVEISSRITRKTFVWYFSPTCPHCQHAAPGVVKLHEELKGELDFIAVATNRSTHEELTAFAQTYGFEFPILIDAPKGFAWAVGASSTPTAVVIDPRPDGFFAVDAYYPWFNGAELILKIRLHPEAGFAPFEAGHYYGNTACSACHSQEAQSWALSHHAIAYRTLYMKDAVDDPKCVSCHVVGMGQPTGFELGDHASNLTNVGCEACHGPGGPHDGARQDARESCAACHDAEHSIAFSVDKGLPHIDHYLANTLSDREREQRMIAMANGELPRPLLAFPEGKNQGVQACATCHPAEVQAWSKGPHGDAVATLSKKERGKEACMECHQAPAGTTDGGVGCESCHGPGEQHAANPLRSNILGMGESCPTCVIEAVCTSCHTREQDPDWVLESALEAAKHHP